MTTKHGIILYSSTAGVEVDDPDDDFEDLEPQRGPGGNGRDNTSNVPNAHRASHTGSPTNSELAQREARVPQREAHGNVRTDLGGDFEEEDEEDDETVIDHDEIDPDEIYEEYEQPDDGNNQYPVDKDDDPNKDDNPN
jgi:hypothetical protein